MSEAAIKLSAAQKKPVKAREASGKRAVPRTDKGKAGAQSVKGSTRSAKQEKSADAPSAEAKVKNNRKAAAEAKAKPAGKAAATKAKPAGKAAAEAKAKPAGKAVAEAKAKPAGKAAAATKAKPAGRAAAEAKAKPGGKAAASGTKPRATGASTSGEQKSGGRKSLKGKTSGRRTDKSARRKATAAKIGSNPVGKAANRRHAKATGRKRADDLFLERSAAPETVQSGGTPPGRHTALFGALNACLAIVIAVLAALGLRVHSQYGEFLAMRDVVDKQTFYKGPPWRAWTCRR